MRYVQQNGILVPRHAARTRQRGFIVCGPAFFGAPASSGGDPFWSSVFSLCSMQGTNGSTSFPDQISGRVWTPHSASITNTQSPYTGGTSGAFSSGYLETTVKTDFEFISNNSVNWTVDIWARVTSLAAVNGLFGSNKGSSANEGIGCWINTAGKLTLFLVNTGTTYLSWVSPSAIWTAGGGFHLVSIQWTASISSPSIAAYVDGTLLATLTPTGTAPGGSFALDIGGLGGGAFPMSGNIADWRATKALRYSANFTPPTSPWPNHA